MECLVSTTALCWDTNFSNVNNIAHSFSNLFVVVVVVVSNVVYCLFACQFVAFFVILLHSLSNRVFKMLDWNFMTR